MQTRYFRPFLGAKRLPSQKSLSTVPSPNTAPSSIANPSRIGTFYLDLEYIISGLFPRSVIISSRSLAISIRSGLSFRLYAIFKSSYGIFCSGLFIIVPICISDYLMLYKCECKRNDNTDNQICQKPPFCGIFLNCRELC